MQNSINYKARATSSWLYKCESKRFNFGGTHLKTVKETIHAKGIEIGIYTTDFENEYISLTDIARYRSSDPRITIHSWLRSRDIIEFLGLWEVLHNSEFKRNEVDTVKTDAGTNAFTFSIKDWNEILCGKGIITKSGRYGGQRIETGN